MAERFESPLGAWSTAALNAFEDLRSQVERNVAVRVGRGNVRSAILRLLAEQPMHGYQIMQELSERSSGAWKPSPGAIYPALQLLSDEGLVTDEHLDGKRVFSLTDLGREAASAEAEQTPAWEVGGSQPAGPRGALAKAGIEVAKAAAEVARVGSAAQLETAAALLRESADAVRAVLGKND
ncbi:MAG TPA: PadR family transcriptional regulator [Microbacteriaceae bacterium]|nr:PadR family transcriptional regulator [Microbacteriaceae bacterium]